MLYACLEEHKYINVGAMNQGIEEKNLSGYSRLHPDVSGVGFTQLLVGLQSASPGLFFGTYVILSIKKISIFQDNDNK